MKKILAMFFTILFLTACSETTKNDYKFIGESDHWEAEYLYKGIEKWGETNGTKTYSNDASYEFVLKYKGSLEELSSLQKLEYSYQTDNSSGKRVQEFTEPPSSVTFSSSGASKGGSKLTEDAVIKVNVKWGDLEESFDLHNLK